MYSTVNIHSMNDDFHYFAFNLEYIKENNKSIYAESTVYGDIYRIEKKTKKVFKNGKQIANTCEYTCY